MAKRTRPNPADFTVAQLEAMLAAKAQIDELEAQRAGLMTELDKVDKALAKLLSGATSSRKPARKKAAKKVARKKAAKRGAKKAAKKSGRGRAAKKVAKKAAKKAGRKKAAKKTAKRAAKAKAATGRPTIESVVVDLLTKKGEPMAFKDILAEIQKRKLIKSKAADFSNVLRRTLSTSERVKRVGRGVYGL